MALARQFHIEGLMNPLFAAGLWLRTVPVKLDFQMEVLLTASRAQAYQVPDILASFSHIGLRDLKLPC